MHVAPLLVLSLAALPVLAGNVYKWTDASGQVHYSQTPPPKGGVSAQSQKSIQPGVSLQAPKPPPPPPVAAKPVAAAAVPDTADAKAKRCAESKQRVAFLEEKTARRLMVQQADGSEARMTEEQFAERMAKAQEAGKGC